MNHLLKNKIEDLKSKKHYLKIFSIVYNNNDNYIENKQKNIKNKCCPLCRS